MPVSHVSSTVGRRSSRSFACAALAAACLPVAASATPLIPNDYVSLGTLQAGASVVTNTSGTPTMTVNGTTYTGVVVSQGAGLPEIAVFTFDFVFLSGAQLNTTGTRPLAILSRGNMLLQESTMTFSGGGANSGTGATGGVATVGGGGGGGNGGAGGNGGSGFANSGGAGGAASPSPLTVLSGGRSGGNGTNNESPINTGGGGAGGLGGGGLEFGATDLLSIGNVNIALNGANGASSGVNNRAGGGGGSGGGLVLHGGVVDIAGDAVFAARGGDGGVGGNQITGEGPGGGGGGGRIVLALPSFSPGASYSFDVRGGSTGLFSANVNFQAQQPSLGGRGNALIDTVNTTVPSGRILDFQQPVTGATAFRTVNLTIQAGGVSANADVYNNVGTFNVNAGGVATNGGAFTNSGGRTVNVDGTLALGGALANNGTLNVNAGSTVSVAGAVTHASGARYFMNGGTLSVPSGLNLTSGVLLQGRGTVVGPLSSTLASPGGLIVPAGSSLSVGDATRTDGVSFDSDFQIGTVGANATAATLILNDADRATIGAGTIGNNSALRAPNGITLLAGRRLTGNNDSVIDGNFVNNGTVDGAVQPGKFLTFVDDVSGAGDYLNNVRFSDGFSPGNSPARVSLHNAAFDGTTELTMELAGLTAGSQYDQLAISGSLALAGKLNVITLNGFTPTLGNSFTLVDGPVTGGFGTVSLPALANGLSWQTTQTGTFYNLTVVPEPTSLGVLSLVAGLLLRRRNGRA